MIIDRAIRRVAGATSLALVEAGRLGDHLLRSASSAYYEGIRQAREQRREMIIKSRSERLHIPPELYEPLAQQHGEEALMGALLKSEQAGKGKRALDWRGFLDDPHEPMVQIGGYTERPSILSYEMLAQLGRILGPFAAYRQTRLNQIGLHCHPQHEKHGVGFVVRKRKDPKPDDKRGRELEQVVMDCGFTPRYDEKTGETRAAFPDFMRQIVGDTIHYDQINFEKRRTAKGALVEWRPLDAKTIRRLSPGYKELTEIGEPARFAQVLHGAIMAEFSPLDLAFCIRNPRTDIRSYGYGLSELEMMVNTVTGLLNGFDYNSRFFTNGTTTKGLLALHGLVPPSSLRHFKRMWYAMVTGAANAWRTPILNMPDDKSKAEWIDLQKSNLDMEWSRFMEWCLKIGCAVWQIAPEELNFQFGNQGQSQSMNSGDQSHKVGQSKDKGLRPILDALARFLTEHIVSCIDEEYEFAFVGLDQESEGEEVKRRTKEVQHYKTVDEVRAEADLEPLPDGKGEVILNTVWQQAAQMAAMAQQGGAEGEGPPEGGEGPAGEEEPGDEDEEPGGEGDVPSPEDLAAVFGDEGAGGAGEGAGVASRKPGAVQKSLTSRARVERRTYIVEL